MTTTTGGEPVAAQDAQARRWITVHFEDGQASVTRHADQPYGERRAAVHLDVEAPQALLDALTAMADEQHDELEERALDAVSEHRVLARNRGEDHRAPLAYVGPEVTAEEGVYSDPRLMEMPAGERAAALERSVAAIGGGAGRE